MSRQWLHAAITCAFLVALTGIEPAARTIEFAMPRMLGILAATQLVFFLVNVALKSKYDLLWRPLFEGLRFVRGVFIPMVLFIVGAAWAIALFGFLPTAGRLWTGADPPPPPAAFGSLLVVIGASMAVQSTLGALGYPPAVYGRGRKRYKKSIEFSFILYTAVAAAFAGKMQDPISFALGLVVVMMAHAMWMTRNAARQAYFASPVAKVRTPLRGLIGRPRFFHLTDVHLTDGIQERAEGGMGGNTALLARVPAIAKQKPAFGLLTGDLTDHGADKEWDVAMSLLQPLREAGCRLLVVPGNHDLSPAYDTADASTVVAIAAADENPNIMRSARLRRYLERACALDPSLMIPGGTRLKDIVERESAAFVELSAATKESRVSILEELVRARLALPEPLTQEWQRRTIAATSAAIAHSDGLDAKTWRAVYYELAWWDYFPLSTFDGDTGTEIFLLNSISPNVDMFGSAWGNLGEMQVARLEHMLAQRYSAHVAILIHHAPFRWADEPPPGWKSSEMQRWAFLAAGSPAMNRFVRLLADTREREREVILFCGHRHGGAWGESRLGDWPGGIVAEGASLADAKNTAILCAWMGDHFQLELGTLADTRS